MPSNLGASLQAVPFDNYMPTGADHTCQPKHDRRAGDPGTGGSSIMDVSNITAVSAIIIAVASLSVSVMEARAARRHNRQSVRPILQINRVKQHSDMRVGLRLRNVGFGPAIILNTKVTLDGTVIGAWDRDSLDLMVNSKGLHPKFSTLYKDEVIPSGHDGFLIHIDNFNEKSQGWFWELIAHRLSIEIAYESIYGDKTFRAFKHPRQDLSQRSPDPDTNRQN